MYRFMGEDLDIVGVDMGEYTLSPETVNKTLEYLTGLRVEHERLTEVLDRVLKSWEEYCLLCERIQRRKRRKTTYRTIRRDCAKRNRHK